MRERERGRGRGGSSQRRRAGSALPLKVIYICRSLPRRSSGAPGTYQTIKIDCSIKPDHLGHAITELYPESTFCMCFIVSYAMSNQEVVWRHLQYCFFWFGQALHLLAVVLAAVFSFIASFSCFFFSASACLSFSSRDLLNIFTKTANI